MVRYDRLRRSRDLDRVFRCGRWLRLGPVSVGVAPRDDAGPARVAFAAGRGIGTAVRRNRARRRMREALRTSSLSLRDGHDIVLVARPDTADVPFSVLQQAVGSALLRLGAASNDSRDEAGG